MISRLLCRLTLAFALVGSAHAQSLDAAQRQALREQAQAHEHGEGQPRDVQAAIRLYCQAALAGDLAPGERDAARRRAVNAVFVDGHRKSVDAIRSVTATVDSQ